MALALTLASAFGSVKVKSRARCNTSRSVECATAKSEAASRLKGREPRRDRHTERRRSGSGAERQTKARRKMTRCRQTHTHNGATRTRVPTRILARLTRRFLVSRLSSLDLSAAATGGSRLQRRSHFSDCSRVQVRVPLLGWKAGEQVASERVASRGFANSFRRVQDGIRLVAVPSAQKQTRDAEGAKSSKSGKPRPERKRERGAYQRANRSLSTTHLCM